MAKLPKPDWITLSESASRVARAFGAELSAVKAALINAFHNRKIRTRGRLRPYFGNNRVHDLPYFFWDRAKVHWQINKFVIPSGQLDPMIKTYLVWDVDVCREGLEKWINGAMPDSQHGSQEAAENLALESPEGKPMTIRDRAEGWLNAQEELRKNEGISWREAAKRIARSTGVDSATVEREARRIRRERDEDREKSGKHF